MFHFVVQPHDSGFPYEEVCKKLFGENKCMVVLEKKKGEHCHVQGELKEGVTPDRALINELNELHPKRKRVETSRPVKRRKLEADETGFQYMLKEAGSEIIYNQGFTEQEIKDYRNASGRYVDELQCKLGEYVYEQLRTFFIRDPSELHRTIALTVYDYYLDCKKVPPPNIKSQIIWIFMKYWGTNPDVREYISSRWI